MKTTIILRSASVISSVTICLVMLAACGNRAGDLVENKGAGAVHNESGAIPASPVTSSSPTTNKAIPATTQSSTTQTSGDNKPHVASVPPPQVGTGGSDFFLFTQARSALGADNGLKAANIVIDVKSGLLTLSGTVANADQKSKAEQLVRAVDGVKAVKNQLRVSLANAELKSF